MNLTDRLREVPLFAGLAEEDLVRLCRGTEVVRLAAGDLLFAEGDRGDSAYVVLEGELEIVKASAGGDVLLALQSDGVVGEMALLEDAPRNASARARHNAALLAVPKDKLDDLINSSPSAARAFFGVMLARWRATQSILRQSERMVQLGTLTAGLAHELSNPAAAVNRGAEQLSDAMTRHGEARSAAFAGLDDKGRQSVEAVLSVIHERGGVGSSLSSLARSDLEDAVTAWLEDRGVERPWELATAIVDAGFTPTELADFAEHVASPHLGEVVRLLAATQEQLSLLHQIEEGTRRMSEIVRALKSYAFLDQAPLQDVDVVGGLEDTLLLLQHKEKGVEIDREYAANLPAIEARGSELNQVWTNLIDNALDALADTEAPRLTIRTEHSEGGVVVEIEDNGPGVPDGIQHRIFDSFFTTKPPGSGTGLGLDISRNIVVARHSGNISVDSAPGRTVFRVELPLRLPG
ncbi:MAG: ATP-binding protein [Acidimicrobiia bacterium]|nr:ATP-binding protein [Acidimicrobiia bacterium]